MTWTRSNFFLALALLITAMLFSAWSYVFVDPNLLLLNRNWWVEVQNWFWQVRGYWPLLALQYSAMLFLWWGLYLLGAFRAQKLSLPSILVFATSLIFVLWLGHNALSHDIFNYLFNAKMVVEYGVDPHTRTALEFSYDPWVRFMHNVHTTAPYGYGWTVLSVIPYLLGFGSFLLAYLSMKVWMVLGLMLYVVFGWSLLRELKPTNVSKRFWLFALNPLLLLETALNGHNDVWMMWPAMAAFVLLLQRPRKWGHVLLAVLLFAISISIKLVTVVLVPIGLLVLLWPHLASLRQRVPAWLRSLADHGYGSWPEYASIALLVPLVTDRSQQFLPWYLIWSWSFFPVVRWRWLRWFLIALSFTSLLRYVPWLINGLEYSEAIQLQMRAVTWAAVFAFPIMVIITHWRNRAK